jgi:phosphohistidine swiveling domain-containing protein
MRSKYILELNDQNATLEMVGGKGTSLAWMANAGFSVPRGFYLTTEAYRSFVAENNMQPRIMEVLESVDVSNPETFEEASRAITKMFIGASIPDDIATSVIQAYSALPGPSPAVAVRSSATAEDLPEASFAGQQETYLNLNGSTAVLEATRKCWASLWTGRAISYRLRQGIHPESVALAVVIQILIPADAAGILFTANPVDGNRDQMVISASWGLGEAVVGGLVTPDNLTVEKSSGLVIQQQIAEKHIQTICVDGGTAEEPVSEQLRSAPVLSDQQAAELSRLGCEIEALYGQPMDIEWALADGEFAILQARPITALPVPEPPVPTEWSLPKGAYAAMRNNIVELMADPLSPLFSTMGLKVINSSMNELMTSFFGQPGILPENPIITVNQYAYYNGSIKPGAMLKIFLYARRIMKRMFTGAVERWTEDGRPEYIAKVRRWREEGWQELSAREILSTANKLTQAAIDAYFALVSGVIPAAWISEGLFTMVYKFIKRRDDPIAPTYLMGYESIPIQAEKSLYDLAEWTHQSLDLVTYILNKPAQQIVSQLSEKHRPIGVTPEDWFEWRSRFQAHLENYGYMIYNLDFANPVPLDDPVPVLDAFKLFLSGEGVNPHNRQGDSAERREQATQTIKNRLKGLRLKLFSSNLARAQKYAPLREDGLAEIGLSYPLVRQMLLELGRRFSEAGVIGQSEDIFWLEGDEVETAATWLDDGVTPEDLSAKIPHRLAIWQAARKATPPVALPQMKLFGVDLRELKSRRGRKDDGVVIKGVAASPGTITAPACILHGPEDFSKMRTGDVLVAPLTTPAWTPLFARASAVVTDVGGPLSHGSIVAREYGIPAVLGTGEATRRLQTGQVVRVDGGAGLVTLVENALD